MEIKNKLETIFDMVLRVSLDQPVPLKITDGESIHRIEVETFEGMSVIKYYNQLGLEVKQNVIPMTVDKLYFYLSNTDGMRPVNEAFRISVKMIDGKIVYTYTSLIGSSLIH